MIVTISSNLEKALRGTASSAVNCQLSAALSTLVLVQISKALTIAFTLTHCSLYR